MTDNQIQIVRPCPPHQWSHAPTVGYFRCDKCGAQIDHGSERYAALEREFADFAAARNIDRGPA